jgi:hypothetical protein
MTYDTELNHAEQCFNEAFGRERAVGYEVFEHIDSL